jgi:hypothetical protein
MRRPLPAPASFELVPMNPGALNQSKGDRARAIAPDPAASRVCPSYNVAFHVLVFPSFLFHTYPHLIPAQLPTGALT